MPIISGLLKSIPAKKDYDWLWPKGGALKDEDTYTTAIRETFEETGILIPREQVDFSDTIDVEVVTFFSMVITNHYYIAILDSEQYKIPEIKNNKEVLKAEWVSFDEAFRRLDKEYAVALANIINMTPMKKTGLSLRKTGSNHGMDTLASSINTTCIATPV
jgi:8-oxo-dGTP pyrophosphatase MutT (NUDIX family)